MKPHDIVQVTPGHLAGPGNPDTAFDEFFENFPTWSRWHVYDETSQALHERLTARIELDHEATAGPRWTIVDYHSPVDELAWRATFCVRTPVEIVTAVALHLTSALDCFSLTVGEEILWGRRPYADAIRC